MIRWRASATLSYSGEQLADVVRAAARWSQRSHIPVDVTSALEAVDQSDGTLSYDLEVLLALQTGGPRQLADLAAYLVSTLDDGWTVAPAGEGLRCEFDKRRARAAGAPPR
ncbi:MAG: hypothetical protein AB7O28_07785 [Vicinamibacterales bacterium]